MNKAMDLLKRIILFFVGMSIIQFGVALFLKTNIGSDPFTVFTQGLAFALNKTGLRNFSVVKMISGTEQVTPGVANMIILIVLFAIILLVERTRIKIGTLICVVGVGPIIDLGVKVVSYFPVESYNYFIKALLVIFGCLIIAIGFAVLSATNVGVAPNDIVPFIIQDKTKVQYRWIRITLDAGFLIIGFILGGKVGIGTVIAMITTGPFIQFCLPYGEKFVNLLVNEKDADVEDSVTATV
ncbi:YczE/YyaS/YitT family protein [Clostridium beijerinckii]|uniref:YczE/YyaS/YitT family protein n=1 Tax=Clostridium beijerinckii TaxID=1520 RepID=UPI0004797C1A|nr:membrane protein [Clostridium beijerinckii]